jgi:GH15 family glucan-1,4-alpha-glucosidase
MASRIEDYALIGDCETAALVARDGSIDWLCWPRFDSGAVFARLVGEAGNGHWSIAAADDSARISRCYRGNTLILETDFETAEGAVTLIDFMTPRFQIVGSRRMRQVGTSQLIRIVRGRRGAVAMTTEFVLRFDYGAVVPWITRLEDRGLKAIGGPDLAVLRTSVELEAEGYRHSGRFTVSAGESVSFVLAYGPSYQPEPQPIDPFEALEATEQSWEEWASQCEDCAAYSGIVMRSLITLKALIYRPTGGIVAAPTTSLPELLGGNRNWDYRFCWLRDATFTLMALVNSGFHNEAREWGGWLRRAVAGDPAQVQIMYGIAGERRIDELVLPWLEGYEGAKPVRIGNAAAGQLQLDIYGEVMDALFQASTKGLAPNELDRDLICALIEHLETVWQQPDDGIWEVRGPRRHFTHSKVMAWVAFDRAIKEGDRIGAEYPQERWRAVCDRIHEEVCDKGYNKEVGAFTQYYGSAEVDASALLISLVGFLPPSDPRVKSTVEAIERHLLVDGFVLRYRPQYTDDGLRSREGAFLACSFWLADNYVLLGRHADARALFERLVALTNDVGLLAEEYDSQAGRMVGNFPQAFSHVALINAAHNLSRDEKPAEQRAGATAQPAAGNSDRHVQSVHIDTDALAAPQAR